MKVLSKISLALNSRFTAFVDMMFGACSIVFFYAGVQWEKQWMATSEIAIIYSVLGICFAANLGYLILRAVKGEHYLEISGRKAIEILHFFTGLVSFGLSVYSICMLFGVNGGISTEEIQRATNALHPVAIYLVIALTLGITLIFVNGARRTIKAVCTVGISSVAVILVISVLTNASLSLLSPDPNAEKIDLSSRTLIWSDEFEGDKLDETKWRAYDTDTHTTFYTPEQITVHDGHAYLKTEYIKNGKYGDGFYGAWLTNQDFFKNSYGYYEIRCIMPKAEGLHAAFWTFGDNTYSGYGKTGAEVDIFENAYYRVNGNDEKSNCKYTMALHTGDDQGNVISTGTEKAVTTYTKKGQNMYEGFHTYGLEWTKDSYTFYYDGIEVGKLDFSNGPINGIVGTCEVPEYLFVSTHVGSQIKDDGSIRDEWNGNAFNNPEGTFPQNFVVDYVRVYAPVE